MPNPELQKALGKPKKPKKPNLQGQCPSQNCKKPWENQKNQKKQICRANARPEPEHWSCKFVFFGFFGFPKVFCNSGLGIGPANLFFLVFLIPARFCLFFCFCMVFPRVFGFLARGVSVKDSRVAMECAFRLHGSTVFQKMSNNYIK